MEKTVKFSVFKEKIIKTNELLELHLKKTKELEKIQKCYQQLKRVLELNRNENKKLKLKNETVAYNLQLAEKNYGSLKEEFSKLKLQFNQLEDESSKTINNLQINYQLASQELKECKDKLSKFNEEQNVNMKQKSPAKKKKRVDIPSVDTGIINQKISQLTAEKQRLAKENDNLKLEMYELKKQLYKLQCFEDDPHTVKSMEKKLIEKQQELTDLKTKLKTIEENNVNEISRLAEELKHVKLGKSQVEIENEKLKNETCSFKIEISMLQENERQNMNEIKKMKEENETLVIENDTLKDMIRQNNATPCDDQIAAIMDEIATPTLLPPLNDFSELSPVNVPHVENAPICPVLEPKETSSSGDFVISSYTDITKTTKKPNSKKIRKILKKKPKKIDLFGALLALKQAKINFVISSDLIHLDKISSPFIDNPCPAYTESTSAVTEKKHSDNLIRKLSCNLPCCRNSLMLLKGDKSENAPLLGFCHVKDESYLKTEYFFDNRNCTKAIPSLKSPKKRKKFKSIGEKPLKRLTRHHENCSDDEVQHKSHQEQESENDPNGNYSAESIDPLKENVLLKTCDTNVKVDRGKKKESCSTVINSKKITQHKYTTRRSNSFDNTFGASTRKRIAHAVNQTKSVSQNVNNSFSPVKSSSNCKNLQNGREYGTCISSIRTHVDCSTNQSELISPVTNNQKSGEIVTSKITIKPKSPKTTFKRPLCGTRRSPRLSAAQSETQVEINEVVSEEVQVPMKEDGPPKCPESPTSENKGFISSAPKLIPLERTQENVEKMATTKIEVLFVKLINSSMEEEVLNEVVREFSNQNPEYIA
ncbi:kinectin-like, partial [Asbolus verrucosus]